MIVKNTELPGVLEILPVVHKDSRGHFLEVYNQHQYDQKTGAKQWLQDNLSYSTRGVVRGLHLQWPKPQGKLVSAVYGRIFDVAVDVRQGSEHFGHWVARILDHTTQKQLWVPPGFAHGFQVLSDTAAVHYKCSSNFWSQDTEICIRFNDPDIGVDWPIEISNVSTRDQAAPYLNACGELPYYESDAK